MMEFYHNKGVDMLKLGCTLPILANICLQNSTNNKLYPFVEADKDFHDKIRKDMTGGPYIVFTKSGCGSNIYSKLRKHLQINCWFRRQSTLPLLNVSRNAHWGFTLCGSLIQTLRSLKLGKTNRGNLRSWLCRSYNLSVLTALLKVTT